MLRNGFITFAVALALAACGGKGKHADTAGGGDDVGDVGDGDDGDGGGGGGDVMVPPEKMDAIRIDLDRKRTAASRCLVDAVEAGKADKSAHGMVTLEFVVTTSGKPRDVKVAKSTLKAQMVEDCVVALVEGMQFDTLPRDLEWSYTFAFETY